MCDAFGEDRPAFIGRELTKLHEECRLATLADLRTTLSQPPRGEFVVIIGPAPAPPPDHLDPMAERLLVRMLGEVPLRRAVDIVADVTGVARNLLYQRALALTDQS